MGRALKVNSETPIQLRALAAELDRRVNGEVRFDSGSRSAYSTDASNYRQVPIGVVIPKTPEAAVEAVAVCREHDVPILSRGGGTSLAGQCCNAAVVIDWSKYCTRVTPSTPGPPPRSWSPASNSMPSTGISNPTQ